MSKEFSQRFFPKFTSFLSSPDLAPSFLVGAWNNIFPEDVSILCSLPPKIAYFPQRPCLAIAAIYGAFIGLNSHFRRKKRTLHHDDSARRILAVSIQDSWSRALLAFGSMNVAALVHHCIIPPPKSYRNELSAREFIDSILWAADCIFTGLSSINLFIMAYLLYISYTKKFISTETLSLKQTIKRLRKSAHVSLLAIAVTTAMCLQLYCDGYFDFWVALRASIGMVYLIPLKAAALCLLPFALACAFNVSGAFNTRSVTGARIAILGTMLIPASLCFDASMCRFVSKHAPNIKSSLLLHDVHHLPTLIFIGCDITFVGFDIWVNGLIQELLTQNKKGL
mmetsp:Transcript_13078/g.27778  ORF Transcript_13078/g.27778 Transcript_13078/m.27778 type:complete len:338 (+) Transcript_13078:115-1128(+)